MNWWGKLLGGAFGFMLGGPLGAMMGAAMGHSFDRGLDNIGLEGPSVGNTERVQTAFFATTFLVMGHIAKSDGRVSHDELNTARRVMADMRLNELQRKTAMKLFGDGKAADFPLDDILEQFRVECHRRSNLIRMFIEIQLAAAYADGNVHAAERAILERICAGLRFPRMAFSALEARYRAHGKSQAKQVVSSLEEAYAVLSVTPDTPDAEVTKAYRRLMSQHHPDKLVAQGLPEEMMKIATDKTHEIKEAYKQVKRERGL